jgi:hypothetical protein
MAPGAIEPDAAACLTANTVWMAGLDLDRLSSTPLGPKLAMVPAHPSYLITASDGRDLVLLSHGNFEAAPAGSILINPHLAISGPAEPVRAAVAQHKTGATGAPDLLAHAGAIAKGAPIWAVARGGLTLPLTGNAANLNRLLRLVDYATVSAKLGARLDVDLTGVCRNADDGLRLEETLRAILSMAGAANRNLEPVLRAAEIRRDGVTVHATLSTDPDTAARLIDSVTKNF